MQAATIVFPFKQTFRRLELEKRWWHRLCIVAFFAVLLCTAAFSGWIAYMTFVPEISKMPIIQAVDIFDRVAAEQQNNGQIDLSAGLVPKQQNQVTPKFNPKQPYESSPSQATVDSEWDVVSEFPIKPYESSPSQATVDLEALARKHGGTLEQLQSMIDSQYVVHQVPMDKVIDALEAGEQRVVDMYSPDGQRGWIPEDKVQAAIKAGFKVATSATLDYSKAQLLDKTIEMPNGSTSHFASTVSDDVIRKQWNHAKNVQTWKAVGAAVLSIVVVTLFVSYVLQGAYRALLYVIFGCTTQAA
jgi:hypothetical protein